MPLLPPPPACRDGALPSHCLVHGFPGRVPAAGLRGDLGGRGGVSCTAQQFVLWRGIRVQPGWRERTLLQLDKGAAVTAASAAAGKGAAGCSLLVQCKRHVTLAAGQLPVRAPCRLSSPPPPAPPPPTQDPVPPAHHGARAAAPVGAAPLLRQPPPPARARCRQRGGGRSAVARASPAGKLGGLVLRRRSTAPCGLQGRCSVGGARCDLHEAQLGRRAGPPA